MKYLVVLLVGFSASASVTCHLNGGDGTEFTAESEVAAKRLVWQDCANKKLDDHDKLAENVDVDQAIADGQKCVNSDVTCR